MKKKIAFFLLVSSFNFYSQKKIDCKELKSGVFEIYDKELKTKTGVVYRQGNYQIEDYLESKKVNIVRIKFNKCEYYFKNHEITNRLDTITWIVSYKKNKEFYNYIAKPLYLKVNYKHEGIIIKKNDIILNKKIIDIFLKLKEQG